MLLRAALVDWVNYRLRMCELGLVARSTIDNQTAIAGRLGEGLGDHDLDALRKSHVEFWVGTRRQTCSPVTVRGEMNVLRQVLNWCVDEQMMVAKPRLPTMTVPAVEVALPSDEAFLWVLAHVPPHHAAALEFMMLTGLSPHELERVQVLDAKDSFDRRQFSVGIGFRPDFAVKQPSRRRWIALNARARQLWFEASAGKAPADTVFPSGVAMQKAIRRAMPPGLANDVPIRETLGFERITPKLMRKWFASKVAGEQPEHVLQRLMGHAPGSPITRRHYVRSNDEQLVGAVEALRT